MPSLGSALANTSVTAKVGALAGTALLTTAVLGGVVAAQVAQVDSLRESLRADHAAAGLVLQLDTRASELKVDAYKALVRKDPAEQLPELEEDFATPKEMLAELATYELAPAQQAAVTDIEAAFGPYMAQVKAFVEDAVADQGKTRARWEDIQKANDTTDAAVSAAKESFAAKLAEHEAEMAASTATVRRTIWVTLAVGLLLVAGMGLAVARAIVRPLRRCVEGLDDVAAGDLTTRVEVAQRDELGRLGDAVNRTVAEVREAIRLMGGSAQSLSASSQQLSGVASSIAVSSEEASAQANVVAAAAEQVSRNVQTVATGSQEMGASIREIAHNASEAAHVAAGAVIVAETTNATVVKLGDSSREIGDVVKVITSIAEQTNLLALNATIEAARAGEAGKGFAVVANEVKELAQETARATEDISRRVEAIQADTSSAVSAIGEIGAVIARINDFQMTIASAVEEQTATTNEMNHSVAEAATGSTEIAVNITGVAQAATTTTEGVAHTQQAASELARMSSELQALVSRFTV